MTRKPLGLPISWIVTPVFTAALGGVIGLIYLGLSTPLYEVIGAATVARSRIESPHMADESTRNRWIWVRDGMTIRNELASDDFVAGLLDSDPLLKARFEEHLKNVGTDKAPPADLKLAYARRLADGIKIEYTGGDSSTFIINVKDRDRELAKRLAEAMLTRLRDLTITADSKLYAEAIKALEKQLAGKDGTTEMDKDRRHYLSDTLSRLIVTAAIDKEEAQERFTIVRRPYLPAAPSWPSRWFTLAVTIAGGFFVGCLVEYGRASVKHARK